MPRLLAACCAAVVLMSATAGVAGAQTPPTPLGDEARDLLKRVQAAGLESSRNRITVYYPAGHEAKALRLRALVEQAMDFYDRELGVREELHLAVLLPDAWASLVTWQPYGIPGVAGTPPVAFLPATDDNLAANDALSIRANVSPETMRLIEAAGLSYEDASRRYVDLVGLHELGHTYTRGFGIRVPSRWAGEMLATYFAYAHLRAHDPKQAEVWDGILRAYRDAVRPNHTTLADFERLYFGVGPQNYIWYQAQFQQMVRRVYDAQGLDFLRAVREAFPAGETGTLTPEETLRRFDRIFPGFEAWSRLMRPEAQEPRVVALTNVTVIDGTGAASAPGMTILIEGGRIADVFATGAKSLPAAAEVRDLRGHTVIPGLIDAHVHLVPLLASGQAEAELQRMRRAGIVAVREMGGSQATRALRARVRSGEVESPAIYSSLVMAGPAFMANDPRVGRGGRGGGRGGQAGRGGGRGADLRSGEVTSEADVPSAIARAVESGASAIKLYSDLSRAVMAKLASAAHARGLKVWAHPTVFPSRPADIIRVGVDGLSHACGIVWQDADLDPAQYKEVSAASRPRFDPARVDPDGPEITALFTEMASRGIAFDPTLANHARPGDDEYGCTTELMVAVARAAKRAGVTLLAGTDFHAPEDAPFPSLIQEIELLVSSGVLTPLEAIAAATINPARAMGIDGDFGSVAPGKAAALVVLKSDPSQDIRALREGVMVVR